MPPEPTPTAPRPPAPPVVESVQVAVFAPQPAHSGDTVTVIWKHHVNAPAGTSVVMIYTRALYGPFSARGALQAAVEASTIGPPVWRDLLGGAPSSSGSNGSGNSPVSQTFDLPRQLVPGLYDLAVSATLQGGDQTSRAEWPLTIAGGG